MGIETTNIQVDQTQEQQLEAARKAVEEVNLDIEGGEQRSEHQTLNPPENLPLAEKLVRIDFGGKERASEDISRVVGLPQKGVLAKQRTADIQTLRKEVADRSVDPFVQKHSVIEPPSEYERLRQDTRSFVKDIPTLEGDELLRKFRTAPQYLSTEEITQAHRLLSPQELKDLPQDLLDETDRQRISEYEEAERKRLEEERIKAEYEAKLARYNELLSSIDQTKKDLDKVLFDMKHLGESTETEEEMPVSDLSRAYDNIIKLIKQRGNKSDVIDEVLSRLDEQLSIIQETVVHMKTYNESFAAQQEKFAQARQAVQAVEAVPNIENPYLSLEFDALMQNYTGLNPETDATKIAQIREILLSKKTEIEFQASALLKEYDGASNLENKRVVVEKIQKIKLQLKFLQNQLGQYESDILNILDSRLNSFAVDMSIESKSQADARRVEQDLVKMEARKQQQSVIQAGVESVKNSSIRGIQERIALNSSIDRYYPEVAFDLAKELTEENTTKADNLLGAIVAFDKNEEGIKDRWAEVKRKQQIIDSLDDKQRQDLITQEQTIKDFFEKYQVQSIEGATA
jgi:hypothetical protein